MDYEAVGEAITPRTKAIVAVDLGGIVCDYDKLFEVVEKKVIEIPSEVSGIVKCVNPKCITNHQPIRTRFSVHNISGSGFKLHCHYCEKDTDSKEISILSE